MLICCLSGPERVLEVTQHADIGCDQAHGASEACFCTQAIKSVLQECYGNKEAVTDELVDCILKPGLEVRHILCPVSSELEGDNVLSALKILSYLFGLLSERSYILAANMMLLASW